MMGRAKSLLRSLIGQAAYDRLWLLYRLARYGKDSLPQVTRDAASMPGKELILCTFCGTVFPRSGPDHPEFLVCPQCAKSARDRAALFCLLRLLEERGAQPALFLDGAPGLKSLRLLECSPKASAVARGIFEANLGEYITSDFDLSAHRGQIRLDLTRAEDIAPLRGSFDVILCAHVLEHIPDYRLALRSLHELLRPGGSLILQVPFLEAAYTAVTWDEFHGDNTRVFHRFGFDLLKEVDAVFEEVRVMVGLLDFTITSPEISPHKYDPLAGERGRILQAGAHLLRFYGLGNPDLCDALIATKGPRR